MAGRVRQEIRQEGIRSRTHYRVEELVLYALGQSVIEGF